MRYLLVILLIPPVLCFIVGLLYRWANRFVGFKCRLSDLHSEIDRAMKAGYDGATLRVTAPRRQTGYVSFRKQIGERGDRRFVMVIDQGCFSEREIGWIEKEIVGQGIRCSRAGENGGPLIADCGQRTGVAATVMCSIARKIWMCDDAAPVRCTRKGLFEPLEEPDLLSWDKP